MLFSNNSRLPINQLKYCFEEILFHHRTLIEHANTILEVLSAEAKQSNKIEISRESEIETKIFKIFSKNQKFAQQR